MAVFDITPVILDVRQEYDFWDRSRNAHNTVLGSITDWLHENVGECYGAGDKSSNILAIGSGWEVFKLYNGKPNYRDDEDHVVTWHVNITDEAKSVMFALKWTK